ncbi:MAG: hypothetical protein KF795_11525 [Labilithrix sp.]|nr:hypothetical protein [Labilithrix sp.]
MGNWEADHASPMGAPANVPAESSTPPMPDVRAPQETPLWMEGSAPRVQVRRGHSSAAPRSGLHTLLFFGLIVMVVGAAGIGGVAIWGPDKNVKNRTQFATNPPAPTELPSLPSAPDDTPAPVAPTEAAPASATADEPGVAAAATPAATPTAKKAKRPPRAGGKKAR